jgi:ribulose-phosphate 3-epimerase
MNGIVPAILPSTKEDLEDKLLQLQGIASEVQIDIVDGAFAAPASWPYLHPDGGDISEEYHALDFLGDLHLEMDLMVEHPEKHISTWVNAGANRIIIHAESTRILPTLLATIHTQFGHDTEFAPELLSIGLAIHSSTDISLIEPFLSHINFVQFMGIERIGKQGEPFNTRIVPKVQSFKKKYPDMPVQIDGGVSLDTAPALLAAGASRLIVGSALWKSNDVKATYEQFVSLTSKYGIYNES